jgi:Bacterial TSP3 repeat
MNLHSHLQRFIAVIGLGVGLVAFSGVAHAQETAPTINADGNSGRSDAGLNPSVDADGPTLIYGDINSPPGNTVIGPPKEVAPAPASSDVVYAPPPGASGNISATNGDAAALGPGDATAAPGTVTGGSGTALLGPDGTYAVNEISPSNVTVGDSGALAPEPVYEPAPEAVAEPVAAEPVAAEPVAADTAAVDTAAAETTVASETDLDADNYADALELEVGLDPSNPDTDGDGVADGDEVNIYLTDPYTADSDGDGLVDGEELFATSTDPLVWDTNGDGVGDGETAVV